MKQIDILRKMLGVYVDRHGLRPASRNLNVPIDVIKSINDGRNPLFLNAERVMDALGYDVVFQPRSSELDTLKPDNSKRLLVSENLNQSQVNSDIALETKALRNLLREIAKSLDKLQVRANTMAMSVSDDPRDGKKKGKKGISAETAAMIRVALGGGELPPGIDESTYQRFQSVLLHTSDIDTSADVADEDNDDQISESPALYTVPSHDNLIDDMALSDRGLPARQVATIEFEAAAGGGAYNLDEAPVKGQVWFLRSWLDAKGIDATQCNVISVKGESMEPTLPDGSKILVARHRCRRLVGRIFVLNTQDGLIVKRLGKDADGHWQLLSDHPDWEAIDWKRETTVVGEVMWMARSL